jgi:hypothetical protein
MKTALLPIKRPLEALSSSSSSSSTSTSSQGMRSYSHGAAAGWDMPGSLPTIQLAKVIHAGLEVGHQGGLCSTGNAGQACVY